VQLAEREDSEDQKIKRSLEQIRLRIRHRVVLSTVYMRLPHLPIECQ
jgi:hypothetical protein